MDISWDDAQTFLAIAEGGSISAGAERLGLGQPTVSRRIAQLEERLGTPLFSRSKRGAELTEDGARLLPAAAQMARWAGEFSRLAYGSEDRAEGTVRIAAPPALAVDLLAPFAQTLREQHPRLRVEVLAGVDYIDLTRGEADLAIRTRPTNEPELMTLTEGTSEVGIFASPRYVERLTTRRQEEGRTGLPSLDEIEWVTWSRPYEQVAPRPMLERAIPNFEPAFASDNFLVLRSAAVAGLGAMILDVHGAAASGLVPVDIGFIPPPNAFRLVCARSSRFVPRIRVVADLLVERVRALAPQQNAHSQND